SPHQQYPDIGFLRQIKEGKLPRELLKSECGVYKVTNFDELMYSWVQHPEMLKMAKCFAGGDIKSLHHMYINKPPDANATAIHPLHQDMAYFPWTQGTRTIGAWTALAQVNTQNGCIVVIPGSHKRGLLDHTVPNWMQNAGFHSVAEVADVQNLNEIQKARLPLLAAELGPGDTLFFSPYLIHGSGVNRTDKCRKSIVCHYASATSRYTADRFEPAQDFISQEVMVSLKRVGNTAQHS
ncbi:PhyH-domain-containing protein, partial [Gonapodya prolifera JEL478]